MAALATGWLLVLATSLVACEPPYDGPPIVGDVVPVVPSDGLPAEVEVQDAANNLDVVEHDGRVFLAFRTAPNHFASEEAVMWVVSSTDQTRWDLESRIALGRDVREPRLLAWEGRLTLHFAVLGTSAIDFEPGGARRTQRLGPGVWTEPEPFGEPGFIPWRTRVVDGRPYMVGYVGGESIYDLSGDPIAIHFLTTEDGTSWHGVDPERPVVLEGGGSEADFALLEDGSLVAVVRNEAGDETGWGSKICRAPADDLASWTCRGDPRKFDSPLVLRQERTGVWLIARRQLDNDGLYDLGLRELDREAQTAQYLVDYSFSPKRCAIWRVDPSSSTVTWEADLPSRGDTCFAAALERGQDVMVYNYTSPLDGPDLEWWQGQLGVTVILRTEVHFP